MVILDRAWRLRYANDNAARLSGKPKEQLLGQRIRDVFPQPSKAVLLSALDSVREHRKAVRVKEFDAAAGQWFEHRVYSTANLLCISTTNATDITERKKAGASEFKFRSITESAHQAIVTADSQGNISSWNPAAQTLFGYAEREVMGKPLTLLMPVRYRKDHQAGLQRAAEGGKPLVLGKTIEATGLKKDGGEFPLELSISSWRDRTETCFTGIISDISARKKAEESLRRLSGLLLRVQDEERRHPARELHDSTAQTLSALSINLALVAQFSDFSQQPGRLAP